MYLRQIAVATALYLMLPLAGYAVLALAGATANVPTLDVGIGDGPKESHSAYGIEPGVIDLREEGIVP